MGARVIALGQAAAGDDGVGFAIVDELRRRGVPGGVELMRAAEATALIPLLDTPALVVLVDAAEADPPGEVLVVAPDDLASMQVHCVSTHGVGVADVIALARQLSPDHVSRSIRIVAVTIARPDRLRVGLSAPVAAAVGRAADTVLELVKG
jgi:hydrogenase maturation protease